MVISDVIERQIKGLWGADFADESNGIPVIKTNNMSYEGCIDYGEICYRSIDAESAKENYLHKGDLLVEKSGGTKTHTVGYVNHFDGDDDVFVCNNFILGLRPKKEMVNYMYLFYQLRYMYELGMFSDCYNKTTGIQNLQVKAYLGKSIVVPNMVEQNAVVKVLDTIQKAFDLKRKQLEDLDELVKSKFHEMFGDPVENEKELPTKRFIDVVKMQRGFDLPVHSRDEKGEIPVYGSNGILGYHSESKIDCGVITGRSGTIGEVYYCDTPFWPLNTTLFSVDRHGNNVVYLRYLLEFFDLKRFASGVGVPTLNRNDFHEIQIIDVPHTEQEEFALFVRKTEKAKVLLKQEISDLEELMDSKMDEYFG